jgi:hypothetical protein
MFYDFCRKELFSAAPRTPTTCTDEPASATTPPSGRRTQKSPAPDLQKERSPSLERAENIKIGIWFYRKKHQIAD